MRLSTKGRFAVTAMIDLALHESSGPVPLSGIAMRHQISLSYLEQMFSKLRQLGLVESTRGPGGGYALAREAQRISVADIIGAVEGAACENMPGAALGDGPKTQDMAQDLWDALNSKMLAYMQTVTLHGLAAEPRAKGHVAEVRKPARQGVGKKPVPQPLWTNAPNSVFALGKSMLAKA